MATTTFTTTEPSSSTASTYELHPLPAKPNNIFTPNARSGSDFKQQTLQISDEKPPSHAVEALQRWNTPSINMWRVFATFWSFFVLGMNDGSYGALIPYVSLCNSRCEEDKEERILI